MNASEEIPALIETLLATEQRLEELTGGEVDTVAGRDSRTFLLRRAQEQLRFSEAARQAAILDALPTSIALLDAQGIIISINDAWRRFAHANVCHAPGHGVGHNYFDVCEQARGEFSSQAHQVAAGIRAVLDGTDTSFSIEYPCHSATAQRWFLLTVTPLARDRQNGVVVMHLDITKRRQAETAAFRLAAIVESSGDAIIGENLESIITSWNQGAELLFGYAAEEMVGTSIMRLLPAGQADDHQNILARVRSGENVPPFETVRQTKAGTLVGISVTASPLRDATSKVVGVSIMARDITQRMRTESDLCASQANMAAAQRLAHFGSWELDLMKADDLDANALHWSDEMFRIAGYEPGSVEVSNELFFRLVHPDDREPIRQAVETALRERREYSIVHRLIRADGETRVVQENGQIFIDEVTGQPVKIVGTAHDITERMRAEESSQRLVSIVESSNEAIIGETLEGIVTSWNRAAETIFGYSAAEMIGRPVAVLLPPDHATEERVILDRIIGTKETYHLETRRMRKDGVQIDVAVTISPIRDLDGKIVGASTIGRDITERKLAEEALRKSEHGQREIATQLEAERARLVAAQAVAKVGSWETDLRTLVVTWSAETYRIFEATADSFHGTHGAFLALVHPEDRASVGAAFSDSLGQVGPFSVQHRLLLPDGRIKHVEEHWQLSYDERGEASLAVGTCQDITERKRSELVIERGLQRLNEAQRIGQIGDWEWNLAAQAITWSPQVFEIFGRDPSLGPPRNYGDYAALFDAAGQALMNEKVTLAIESGEAQDYELRAHRPDGTPVDVLGRAVPRKDESGKVVGLVGTVQDITERKRAEQELRRSEELLRRVMDSSQDCIKVLNLDGELLWMNEGGQRIMEIDDFEVVKNKAWTDLWPAEGSASAADALALAKANGVGKFTGFCPTAKGAARWWEVVVTPVMNDAGVPDKILSVSRDITERNRTEEALRKSEAEFRVLAEAMPQIIWVTRPDGWHTHFNQRWMDYTGLTLEESLGHGWLPPVHPEDQPIAAKRWKHANDTGEPYEIEYRLRGADGNYRWVLGRAMPLRDAAGVIVKWFGTCTDIHDLKVAEESLRLLGSAVEQAKESIVITDAEINLPGPRIVFVNPAFTTMTGYAAEEAIGKTPRMVQGVLTDRTVLDRLRHNLEQGEAFHGEVINYRKDGTEYNLEWQITPIRNANGTITHFVAIQRDVTERKRAEAELEQAHRELVTASRLAGMAEVATGILHNVGNVLNSVNVASSCVADSIRKSKAASLGKVVGLLREHEADLGDFLTVNTQGKQIPGYLAQLAEHLVGEQTAALKELAHLQNNIEHIKDIIAMQQNFAKVPGTTELLSVADLAEDALKMTASSLLRHDIVVAREFQEVPLVTVEKHQVLQILVNLVRNAIQACDEANPLEKKITLRATRGNDGVRIAVTDNGIGISAENLTRIFSHGFTTKQSGHGFGLHSAALAVKQMGGSLSVQSDGPGRGAVFILELPSLTAGGEVNTG